MAQQAISHNRSGIRSTESDTPKNRIRQRLFRSGADDVLPITIRHERVYILPTTRGLAFLCVLAIMLMASINYGLNLGYALCFILVGLFAACLLSTYKNLVGIRFVLVSVDDVFQGSSLQYKVKLAENQKRHRCSVSISTENSHDIFDIKPNNSTDATLSVKDPVRGIHALGRLTLSSDFPLGLWRAWGYIHTRVEGNVYPKPENPVVAFTGINVASDGSPATKRSEQEYAGLKSYEKTDSPSHIAWKKVASGAGWYSKQFESHNEQQEIAIRWDDTPTHLNDEQRLSRLCGWVKKAQDENRPFSFELPASTTTKATNFPMSSGREHGLVCLRALAAYQPRHIES